MVVSKQKWHGRDFPNATYSIYDQQKVPDGFTCVEKTPNEYSADLNHGSVRTQPAFLCYRRGHHKPPLVDIGVLHEGKGEKVMADSQILQTTPFGRAANVNNSSTGIYLTYRRATDNAAPNQFAVSDICVILENKGEVPPHTFCKIPKNLNKGMMGSDVFICYKKSRPIANRIAYKPSILMRFPETDHQDPPLPPNVDIFCLPMGAVVECWPKTSVAPHRAFSTFVLTNERGRKFYGAAVTFYEDYEEEVTDEQLKRLGLDPETQAVPGSCSDNSSTNDPAEQMSFCTNKAICVLSCYPFFTAFRRFLFYIHRMTTNGKYALPIERYVSHLMYEVPFPSPRRPRVLVQLGNETISFDNHDDTPLPLSGAAFIDFLKSVGTENAMYVFLLALIERPILVHSLRPYMLSSVAESISSIIFPLHWQCPYIPQCPLDLAGVLHAPMSFICGVDSRYFELYNDPPADVTCIDLDTMTISNSEVRKSVKLSILPRKPAKLLRSTLERLMRQVHEEEWQVTTMRNSQDFVPVDIDYKHQKKRRMLELEIQEAFLRFMASIMKGYRNYLTPLKAAPVIGSTDTGSLFNMDEFMKTRDKSGQEFFKLFCDTQGFSRFIEERSLLSDKNAFLAFFDECVNKVDPASDRAYPKLLEYESALNSDHTIYFTPPEPANGAESEMFTYRRFPDQLIFERFGLDDLVRPQVQGVQNHHIPANYRVEHGIGAHTPIYQRTKHEAKLAGRMARVEGGTPIRWAKCLLSYAYSLWFVHLPAYVKHSQSTMQALRTAFLVLDRMQQGHLPVLDEISYRILMQLCGHYEKPLMTVKVYMAMRQHGLQPNAITYGFYNRAVLEANWPSRDALTAEKKWTTLRHTIRATALFRIMGREGKRNRSLTKLSRESVGLSQSSLLSHGTPPDLGYSSNTTEDSLSLDPTSSRLEAYERIRERTPHIVKNKGSATNLQSVNSPAGLLMSPGESSSSLDTPNTVLNNENDDSNNTINSKENIPLIDDTDECDGNVPSSSKTSVALTIVSAENPTSPGDLLSTTPIKSSMPDDDPLGVLSGKAKMNEDDPLSTPSSKSTAALTAPDPIHLSTPETRRTIMEERLFEGDEFKEDNRKDKGASTELMNSFGKMGGWVRQSMKWTGSAVSTPVSRMIRSQTAQASINAASTLPSTPTTNTTATTIPDSTTPDPTTAPSSSTWSEYVTSSGSRVIGAIQSQKPMEKFRTGMSYINKIKGLESYTTTVRPSISLEGGPLMEHYYQIHGFSSGGDDSSLNEEDGATVPPAKWTKPISANFHIADSLSPNDPAFQLSSGETGSILNWNGPLNWKGEADSVGEQSRMMMEVVLCNASRCPNCSAILYDEDIMSGWMSDECNYNTQCRYCWKDFVPDLTIRLAKHDLVSAAAPIPSTITQSWYNPHRPSHKSYPTKPHPPSTSHHQEGPNKASSESLSSLQSTPQNRHTKFNSGSTNSLPTDTKTPSSTSSNCIQRKLEFDQTDSSNPKSESKNTRANKSTTEKEKSKAAKEKYMTVPFVSPLVLRKEMETAVMEDEEALADVKLMENKPIIFWNMIYYFQRLSVPSHILSFLSIKQFWPEDEFDPKVKEKLIIRCVYDSPHLHNDFSTTPLYKRHIASNSDASGLVAALLLERRAPVATVPEQIIDSLKIPNLRKPIQLLIGEHRKRVPSIATPTRHLPKHMSIYRDIQFLAAVHFGRELRWSDLDEEFAEGFSGLPPNVAILLPSSDHPPTLPAIACRQIFIPLDIH